MRFDDSISVRILGTGSAILVLAGMAAGQVSRGENRSASSVKLQTVSSHSNVHTNAVSDSGTSGSALHANQSSAKSKRSGKRAISRHRGQQKIDPARSREIQEALIREHYMDGTATGVWDAKSQAAMERYQADQGWQHKTVPDSRALIKLGLGPDHEHLLNPESAMTSQPDRAHSSPQR